VCNKSPSILSGLWNCGTAVLPRAGAPSAVLTVPAALVLALGATASFHLAYDFGRLEFLIVVFLACLFGLAWLPSGRHAFYFGLGIGLAIYAPHLVFFWQLFQYGAVALWCILAFWLALFLALGHVFLRRFGPVAWACAAPFFWTGLEYFRSELYYLRFSWLNIGYVFSDSPALGCLAAWGVYGAGFVAMAGVSAVWLLLKLNGRTRFLPILLLIGITGVSVLVSGGASNSENAVRIAGMQLEFPSPAEARLALDRILSTFPDAQLLVLSEYSFHGPVPELIKAWCRKHGKYLIAGGEDPSSAGQYYNTAFVVDPRGEIVFRQPKCVPVQLMQDGLPARQQRIWNSPWGKLGLGICYDASYTRVTDELVRQGAQALIFPTMDVSDWGEAEHRLHARIGPWRAAEYGVPVCRLCSSGISQMVDAQGRIVASAPFPGPNAILSAQLALPKQGRIPLDRWVARLAVLVVVAFGFFSLAGAVKPWLSSLGRANVTIDNLR
jgi:apolipoprotein N-acyltransferase